MPLPNVLVIGAQKCGTTALHRMLEQHPDCTGGRVKETHFLVDVSPWLLGRWSMGEGWYGDNYPEAAIRADVSPSYSGWPLFPGVVERATSVVPDAQIVYLVRDPVDRIVSHWRHWRWRGYETRGFTETIFDGDDGNLFLTASRYATQLRQWLDAYPVDRILVLHQDEVRAGADRLWAFLGVPAVEVGDVVRNSSDAMTVPTRLGRALPGRVARRLPSRMVASPVPRPTLSDATIATLRDLLREEVVDLEAMTGVRAADWS